MSVWGETGVTKDFVKVPNDDKFIEYSGGYAKALLIRLHSREGLTPGERLWLELTTGLFDPYAACQKLIETYQLQRVTERITS